MTGFLRAILIAILTVACIIVFFNLAFFFPFYMEVIQTTFYISQVIATDNYLATDVYNEILGELKRKPIFSERASSVIIEAKHYNGESAIEKDGPKDLKHYYGLTNEKDKPYVQMGNMVTIKVSAKYPFRMKMSGKKIGDEKMDVPVSFTMTTVTTRHYKDLKYIYDLADFDDDDWFDD